MALRRGMDLEAQASEARFEAQQAKLSAELAQLNDRRSGLSRELQESHRSVALQTERVRLATAEVVRAQEVAEKGFLPRQQLDARRSAALEQENELAVLRTAMLRLEREIGEVDARLRALPADGRAQEAEAASARALTLQRRTEVQARSSYVARATRAGRVAVLPVEVGQNLQSGAAVAVLMPVGSGLEAEIYVPSRAAGFIRKGQEVRLMYQAFPYQKFGTSRGTIESVSRTVLSPGELTLPGVSVREPVFRVRVALQDQAIKAYGELIPLQPGMLLRADIVIDRRTLLELLLDPLYAAGRRG
jgi:membrane fusion protein